MPEIMLFTIKLQMTCVDKPSFSIIRKLYETLYEQSIHL